MKITQGQEFVEGINTRVESHTKLFNYERITHQPNYKTEVEKGAESKYVADHDKAHRKIRMYIDKFLQNVNKHGEESAIRFWNEVRDFCDNSNGKFVYDVHPEQRTKMRIKFPHAVVIMDGNNLTIQSVQRSLLMTDALLDMHKIFIAHLPNYTGLQPSGDYKNTWI